MSKEKLTDEQISELVKKLEYQSWALNLYELDQAVYVINRIREENTQLKDRIAELEKENKKYHEVATDCQKIVFMGGECDSKLALKQFAERLKEKLEESWMINNGLWLVDTQVLIDETLKEFINGGK